jgi:general secretion pathway protein G
MHPHRRRARALSAARGVTLIEVMIVVVILGLIASAVAFAVFPIGERSRVQLTHTSAASLRRAADAWRSEHTGEGCPTPERLRDDKFVDRGSKLADPWGTPLQIVCEGDETTVISLGPDRKKSDDDIVEPAPVATRE